MTAGTIKVVIRVAVVAALLAGPSARPALAATVTVPGSYPTIQAAINAVVNGPLASGTTINVSAGTYFEVLRVYNTNASLTVRAVGGAVIVDANGKGAAAVDVYLATGQVVFDGLTFRNGVVSGSTTGGGFLIRGSSPSFINCIFESNRAINGGGGSMDASSPTFTGCTIRNNSALHFGGGVYMTSGSRPVFTNCNIVTNHSGTGGASEATDGAGGGVFSSDSSPTFRGSHINGNTSYFASGGIHHQSTYGSPYGRGMLLMEDSEVGNNVSSQYPGAPNPAEGGGIHIEDNVTATLTRVRIHDNSAGTGGGLNAYRGRYDIVDSVIESNHATNGFGGGITGSSNNSTPQIPGSIVNLTTSLVRNNTAPLGGGIVILGDGFSGLNANLSLTSSVVDNNTSQSQGGGILATRTNLTANGSMIIRNTVSGGGASAIGGGIMIATNSSTTLNNTTIAHNTASYVGGGIYLEDSGLNMTGSQIYDNSATSFGGGGLFVGGTVSSGTIATSIIADNANFQIVESSCPRTTLTYTSNTITPRSGATDFYHNGNGGCAGTMPTTITQFNNLPSGRATGNNSNNPRFNRFLAVPSAGISMTLAWSVARATSVTISGVGTWTSPNNSPTGILDVTPGSSTTYTLTATATPADGGNYGPVTAGVTVVQPPAPPAPPAPLRMVDADFDGDRVADITVFRPSTGFWYIRGSSTSATYQWGGGTDIPVRGDFDGDRKADVAIFRPSDGTWHIRYSATPTAETLVWGGGADVPVPSDYDGDGKTDLAVFRRSNGTWYIRYSGTPTSATLVWGGMGDVGVPADYDGDGKSDVAVFRPSNGNWYIRYSATPTSATLVWGGGSDMAAPVDYDGDGKADIAVFRPSTGSWFIRYTATPSSTTLVWGGMGDTAVPGDYDGDGKADIAVFRRSTGTWYIRYSGTPTSATLVWGGGSDIALLRRP